MKDQEPRHGTLEIYTFAILFSAMSDPLYLVIIFTPLEAADAIRQAAAQAGAGKIGNYDSCSFSARGTGRFRPLEGSSPYAGETGTVAEVAEERIEMFVTKEHLYKTLL